VTSTRAIELEPTQEERIYTASQWQLMWWRFRRHKMAIVSAVVLILLYAIALFCEFVAPHEAHRYEAALALAPPQALHFWDKEGLHLRPFVYGIKSARDPETYAKVFEVDETAKYPLGLLVHGDRYKMWGVFDMDLHLFGLQNSEETMLLLLGADGMGRDVLSRIFYGARISLSIGLVGVTFSLILGVLLGGLSGYYGGLLDVLIQRVIEFLRSLPGIPLWLTLAAALPPEWPPIRVYFGITVILSLLGWTGLARVVRGRFLALREEDFVLAAKLSGANELRIILAHMVPSFTSHLIASLTLSIPAMILSETSLSFLGLGLQAPIISWGVLLQTAQNLRSVATAPWLLLPGGAVVLAVLAFNFVGDGLRDAADPYSR
jgi:peptide/nickel transport system permease protein